MALKNKSNSYGALAKFFHWTLAILIIGLFAMGLWMTGLGYYDDWYHQAPELHKSIGVLVLVLWLLKLGWITTNTKVVHTELKRWELLASKATQGSMQILLLVIIVTGYLMSTSDGRSVSVFELFEIPSLFQQKGLEDTTGWLHEILAYGLIGLASGHALIALIHHFIQKDNVLRSMLPRLVKSKEEK